MRVALLIALLSVPGFADERSQFYGTWGTEQQCARAPIKQGGTVLAAPFEIDERWLKHGDFWCELKWFPVEPRDRGIFTGAMAQCGEDTVKGYRLRMVLSEGKLMLRWGLEHANGPLARCESS